MSQEKIIDFLMKQKAYCSASDIAKGIDASMVTVHRGLKQLTKYNDLKKRKVKRSVNRFNVNKPMSVFKIKIK